MARGTSAKERSAPGRRLDAVHDRVKGLDWEPTYFEPSYRRPTKFKIPKHTKDPFKHLIRQYAAMEEEKDDRMYGSLADVLSRVGGADSADRRWVEGMKFMLPILTQLEVGAQKGANVCIDSLDNPELRSGYAAQVMDEVRHFNQQMYLQRYWAKHWEDPEGFARGLMLRDRALPIFAPSLALAGIWNDQDPFSIAITFQAMAETAYTNVVFCAVTELAAANHDHVTPTVFLSIQSDEARHMANGYAGLAAVLSEPDNLPDLQMEIDGAFMGFSLLFNPYFAMLYDYMATERTVSHAEMWDEWVWDDFIGMYFGRLARFGLQAPMTAEFAREHARISGHAAAVFHFGAWPLGINRFDAMTERDFEWLENKYPGWYETYGGFWEAYREASDPASGAAPFELLPGKRLPALCQVCNHACYIPDPFSGEPEFVEVDGRWLTFCSMFCRVAYEMAPERLRSVPYYVHYDGWSLAEMIVDLGLLRADGKTLLGQPHVNAERLWTIDDIRRQDAPIENPARLYAESLKGAR
jgi:methane monooxygenase component A alpha chain